MVDECFPVQGRKRAEDLNERIMIWSIFVTVAILFVGFGQVGKQNQAIQFFLYPQIDKICNSKHDG